MKNRLDVKVSLFQNCKASGMPVREIFLCDFLSGSTFRAKYKTTVDRYRAAGDEDKNRLKTSLPAVTVSGTFSKRNSAELIAHSGLICIDIDEKDNPDVAEFDRLNELISIIPYVAYCGHSIGGKGYFVIIPIASPEKHKEHFEALRQDFARCGITIDKSGKDVTRLRIYSYDDTAYINPSAATYERTATVRTIYTAADHNKPRISTPKEKIPNARKIASRIADLIRNGTDPTAVYENWFEIACALISEFGESGRTLYHMVSQNYPDYNPDKADRQFEAALKKDGYSYHIGTFFHLTNGK